MTDAQHRAIHAHLDARRKDCLDLAAAAAYDAKQQYHKGRADAFDEVMRFLLTIKAFAKDQEMAREMAKDALTPSPPADDDN